MMLIAPNPFLWAQTHIKYKATFLTMADGLPSNTIHDMEEDDNGYIWIGGTNGLSRFDGYRFTPFNGFGEKGDKMQNIGLLHIFRRQQLLWACTANYAYGCYDLSNECFLPLYGNGNTVTGYNKRFHGSTGQWLYYGRKGVCYPVSEDGKLVMRRYTVANKLLPSDMVNGLAEDGSHHIWVATSRGLARLSGRKTEVFLRGKNVINCTAVGNKVIAFNVTEQACYVFSDGGKLLGMCFLPLVVGRIDKLNNAIVWKNNVVYLTPQGILAFHLGSMAFHRLADCEMKNGFLQGQADGYQLVANRQGHVLLFPPSGHVVSLDFSSRLLTTDEKNKVFDMAGDHQGKLYIATYGMGLYIYDTKTRAMSHYSAEDDVPLIQSDYLNHVMTDHTGCIWLCTESAGLSCLQPVNDFDATYYYMNRPGNSRWANFVRSVYRNKQGLVTLSTKYGKAYIFNNRAGSLTAAAGKRAGINHYMVDSFGNEWVSTCGDGLYVNGVRYAQESVSRHLTSNDVSSTVEDGRHRIWVATWGGGLLMAEWHGGKLSPFRKILGRNYNESHVRSLTYGADGNIYVATLNGLYVADGRKPNLRGNDFMVYNVQHGNFPGNEVQCLAFVRGKLWAGVMASGLVKCDFTKGHRRMTYKVFGHAEGLADNDVCSILQDNHGTLWVGCASGVSRIDSRSAHIQTYALSNHPESNAFVLNSALRQSDGTLLFGTENGLLAIHPADNKVIEPASLPVRITDLMVGGLSVFGHADSTLLSSLPLSAGRVTLSSKQNSITFCYSNFNYRNIHSQLYQVRLDGYDKSWSAPTTSNTAVYAHLRPGRYVFRVRAFDGNRWGKETTFEMKIREPWFNTLWAWLCYVTMAMLTAGYMIHLYRGRLRLDQQMKVDQQVNDMRLNFFTQIAHEFRTPLSIIQSGVQFLTEQSPRSLSSGPMQTISRGSKRLERMINELMEFRRVSTNNKKLQVEEGDIIVFVRNIYQDYWSTAEQKKLSYTFIPFARHAMVPFDASVVECVVYNLLSNAIKYVGQQGSVTLRVSHADEKITISVEDNGPGISAERQKMLFKPFMHGNVSHGVMGIGLYTASQLALTHHGCLVYEPVSPERGAKFVFTLPDNAGAYSPDELAGEAMRQEKTASGISADAMPLTSDRASLNNQTVAIIEDDADMMQQNKNIVGLYFRTLGYANGLEGLEGVCNQHPDLVLCDVKLPDIDGYEVIRRIKNNPQTADIPVIVLTAFDDEKHQLEAYKAGADDYMVKPCSYKLLIARMVQLIKRIAAHAPSEASTHTDGGTPTSGGVVIESRADKVFIENVAKLTSENIGNTALNADFLAERIHMGRTTFFGKMKQLMDTTPNKYILDRRMDYAAELLSAGTYTIAEVCYKVGFSAPSYFNKCFKQKFGMSPTQYKRNT